MAGVSTATVSRVVNQPDTVSDTLRKRVMDAIQVVGWVPNAAARALTSNRTGTIGAVLPALALGDFARSIDAMQDALAARNYVLLLARSNYDPALEFSQVTKLAERGVDGLILVGRDRAPEYQSFLSRLKIPYINSFIFEPEATMPCVGPDNAAAMASMVDYLVEQGHRRFAMIAQTTTSNDRALARRNGVRDALAHHGLAIPPHAMFEGKWSIEEGRMLLNVAMALEVRPTALICGNSMLAVGALLQAMENEIRVPDELSIVGYDDVELMSELPIPITTVRVASEEVGRVSADTVLDMIEGKRWTGTRIPYEIVVRASSGPAPAT
tara:strand:+ start:4211 stop:5188 length:978 start_codon:yes stop_codon:yes gene_type:complete